ncbi:hypothetical protein E2562_033465 [Oryza meyeriana var. granulata]|uniref:Uncharacterized protein n=1 Tax=Oryza meyeriana var. granulata TaxID=110450 RepID=A0A6G1E6V6_9ORYZ|nr:hypothetical protein E2562_033465 [Oryza meyeriana var. granulata]
MEIGGLGERTLELVAEVRRRGAGRTEADGASNAPGSPPKLPEIAVAVAIAMTARVWSSVPPTLVVDWLDLDGMERW